MDDIERYYKVLKVSPHTSFNKIRKSYTSLILKYHPSKPLGRYKKDYFVDLVLSFDLISKINRESINYKKTISEIYSDWKDSDRAFALEKAEQYSKLKFKDFEKEFLPGCFGIVKGIVYFFYFLIAFFAVAFPINEYYLGHISGFGIFIISFGYTIPLFYGIYKTVEDENFFTRRFWFRLNMRIKLLKLREKNKITPANTQYKT